MKTIFNELNDSVSRYKNETIEIADGLSYSQYQTIRTVDFYYNNKYLNGNQDELGREKPFYNINKFRANVATRATDIDIKDIHVVADHPKDQIRTMILEKDIFEWMKESNFSKFLNDAGATRAKYGGVLVKKTEKDGELKLDVVDWRNCITDQVDIENGIIIEKHYMKPSDLSKMDGIWDNVDEALAMATKDRTSITDGDNKQKGNSVATEIFEIHGEFPETLDPDLEEIGNENRYKRMLFIVAGAKAGKQTLMYYEDEKQNPYKYLPYEYVSGRGLGIGIVEDGFEAQVWTNDAILMEKRAMELSGKIVLKTNSKKIGNNIMTDVDNGSIMYMEDGKDITPINLMTGALPNFQNLVEKWNTQYERVSSTFGAITGETMPSGTPYRQTAILNQEAGSLFDYRREEFGIFLQSIFKDWIFPYLQKHLTKEHLLAVSFDADELKLIDDSFSKRKANDEVLETLLNTGELIPEEQYGQMITDNKKQLMNTKDKRFLNVPKDYYKDINAKVTVVITGENKNKGATLESLGNILTVVSRNPAMLQDPILSKIFGLIVENAGVGVSPLSLGIGADVQQAQTQQQMQPQGGQPIPQLPIEQQIKE